jgi:hypothetical protein
MGNGGCYCDIVCLTFLVIPPLMRGFAGGFWSTKVASNFPRFQYLVVCFPLGPLLLVSPFPVSIAKLPPLFLLFIFYCYS